MMCTQGILIMQSGNLLLTLKKSQKIPMRIDIMQIMSMLTLWMIHLMEQEKQ